ncbi:Bug family tripartite tricarboxylate transporter substrate binding protein [Chachezhania sediminis]|uniref:Bug family tripartite tricarboxylate transporter substrate binding protein n=1 Tax=Chachezhania sediminis TaxID=2599291 RepID=UPI00131BB4A5|nr:tripartite tricarboxylate transporter substrate binding protein [Chachezhania sediminis]
MTHVFTKNWTRRGLLAAAATLALTLGLPDTARAEWPAGGLRVIVPYGPGGTSDNITRAVTPKIEEILGRNITIENIGGGGGVIGVTQLAKSKPDGLTFAMVPTATLVIAPQMRKLNYDPLTDIQPVAKIAESYGALAMRKDFPADNLSELIAYAKEHPGDITFGSAGIGSITHLYVEIFANAAGIEVNHVPFKGSSEAMNNVLGGHVDGQFDAVVLRQAQAGAVKPIAILNDERWEGLPDVPTLNDLDFKGFENVSSWFGFIAPEGTPDEAVQAFSDATRQALEDPEVKRHLKELGVIPKYLPSDQFAELIRSNYDQYKTILEPLGLTH